MSAKELLTLICGIAGVSAAILIIPFLLFVAFPFIQNFSPERKFEKFIDEECLKGNEIAIRIRRENIRYYSEKDHKLAREAIKGNQHAIRALKLDIPEVTFKIR